MIFSSDNWAGIAPQIADNLHANSSGMSPAYSTGDIDQQVHNKIRELFECDHARIFYVGTGTLANSLAMAGISRPGGLLFCKREAHMIVDEANAPEFFSAGSKTIPVDGPEGKIDAQSLRAMLASYDPDFVHCGQPAAISMTQATEMGTVYSLDEISQLTSLAREYNIPAHMDGARFANALVHLDATPAQMTWKSGIDLLSFGGTKNGCWCAEALIIFNPDLAPQMPFLHKQFGQLFSKSRFISAQFEAYLENDLWLDLAKQANQKADELRAIFSGSNHARLPWQSTSNEVFVVLNKDHANKMLEAGSAFYPFGGPPDLESSMAHNEGLFRFVTSFSTTPEDIESFSEMFTKTAC